MKQWNFAGSAVAVAAVFALAAVPQMASAAETPAPQPEQATQQTTPKTTTPAEKPTDISAKPTLTQPAAPTEQKPTPQTEPATPKAGTRATCTSPDTDENIIGDHAYWKLSPDCTTLTLGTQTGYTNGTLDSVAALPGTKPHWFSNSNNITSVKIDSPVKANADSAQLFSNLPSATSIDLTNLSTIGTTNMHDMFYGDEALTSLNVSNFDTNNVTDMSGMFYDDEALTSLNVSNFDTKNVTDMNYMFFYDTKLTSLNVSNFDTKNVTDMRSMFAYDTKLTRLDLSNFDTSKVTNMWSMFEGDAALTSLNVSNFDTKNVTDMTGMFAYDPELTRLDLSNFDTGNGTDMHNMFAGDSGLEFVRAGGTAVLDNTNNMPLKDWTNEAGSWNGHPSDGFGNSPVMWYGDPDISTATFDANGAQGAAPAPVSIALWPDASTEFTLPGQGNLTRSGYTFLGWAADRDAQNLDATDSGRAGDPYDTHGDNFTLYAVWVKDASATNGQTGKDPAQNGKKTGQSGKELGATGSTALGVLVAAIALAAAGWGVFHFRKANKD